MAHHSPDADDQYIRELFKNTIPMTAPFGGTGRFPLGRLSKSDEGEIQFGIAADAAKNKVVINFGEPTAWIGFSAEQAEQLADSLLGKAKELRAARQLMTLQEKMKPEG